MFIKRHFIKIILLLCLVIQLSLVIYFKRAVFLKPYDGEYWKNRLEHSQWTLPISRRDIGDDGIYSYGGYRLVNGDSIENTYTNKPPVGIYLIGVSIILFNNPVYFVLITGLATLIIFFLLARQYLRINTAIFATLLLVLNPLFFVYSTMVLLDLIQTFFLILNVYLFSLLNKVKKYQVALVFAGGLVLGLFTETKPPLFTPMIIFLELVYLLYRRKIWWICIFIFGFGLGVILPYYQYFLNGNSLFDYLRLHKYMVSIYSQNSNIIHHFAVLQALFTGKFPDITSGKLTEFSEWWPVLPIIVIIGIVSMFRSMLSNSSWILKAIALFTIFVLTINCFIPSYPRYIIIILPFLILFFSLILERLKPQILIYLTMLLVSIFGFFNTYRFLIPDPQPTLNRFYYNYSLQFFQDIYEENLGNPLNVASNREEFRNLTQAVFYEGTIKYIILEEINKNIDQANNTGKVNVKATYFTQDLGSFTEDKTIFLRKINNEWKIIWDWDLLLNGFKPGDDLQTNIVIGKRGSIIDKNKRILAQDTQGYLISINPSLIETQREQALLSFLSSLTSLSKHSIYNCYQENPLPGHPVAIATNIITLKPAILDKINQFPGVLLSPHIARVYDYPDLLDLTSTKNTIYTEYCTRIYNTTYYHGVLAAEGEFETQLPGQNGGTLNLVDRNGKIIRNLINQPVKNGKDINI